MGKIRAPTLLATISLALPRQYLRLTDRQTERYTERQTDRQTEKITDRRTDRWTNGQTTKEEISLSFNSISPTLFYLISLCLVK